MSASGIQTEKSVGMWSHFIGGEQVEGSSGRFGDIQSGYRASKGARAVRKP